MQERNKLINQFSVILMIISLTALFFFAMFSLFAPDCEISLTENRTLAKYPSFSLRLAQDGTWEKEYETYSLDQFYFRRFAVQSYFKVLDALGVKERNGYVRGLEDCILKVTDPPHDFTEEQIEEYSSIRIAPLKTLRTAADDAGANLISLQIPHKNSFFSNAYPRYYTYDQALENARQKYLNQLLDENGIPYLDVSDLLLNVHRNDYVYYYTDNHWTFRGAYYAYLELLNMLNEGYGESLFFPDWETCQLHHLDGRTVGRYLSKYGDSGIIDRDFTEFILPEDMPEYTMYYNGERTDEGIIGRRGNGYEIFLNGDRAQTVIKTNRPDLPSILYIGYSYKNALAAMSVYSFDEVHAIDPRYYTGNISDYIKNCGAEYVVVVRNDIFEGNTENHATI